MNIKKDFLIFCFYLTMAVIVFMASNQTASCQTKKEKTISIPEDINNIFLKSCMPCHGDKGGRLPTARLKFSRWKAYGPEKEVEKASQICSSVRKGTMPPKSSRETNPELIPTKEQADLICRWAESVKPQKGKK